MIRLTSSLSILSEELSYEMEDDFGYLNYTSYIAASYVKFVESAGARVAPVLFLFPGGGLYLNSSYSKALQKIYEIAKREDVEDDKRVVIWATCLGFENVIYLEAGFDPQVHCNGSNSADNLIFQEGFESSKLLSNVLEGVIEDLATKNITANFHSKCTLPENSR
ncbi:Gamma-glutamyl hydrolase [Armadillidium vulgare]|nr:Gamma-glutamyl hydrolase [Armadillidium vulgare]